MSSGMVNSSFWVKAADRRGALLISMPPLGLIRRDSHWRPSKSRNSKTKHNREISDATFRRPRVVLGPSSPNSFSHPWLVQFMGHENVAVGPNFTVNLVVKKEP